MRLPRLEYPKGQPFVIPHINKCFYATSPIIITFLVVLNTALTGNDIATELKKSPDNTDTKWWAPSWLPKSMSIPTTPGPCQPLAIPQNDLSLHTNSSTPLFTYALLNSFGLGQSQSGPKRSDSKRVSQALPYRSEPLLNCSVQEITALLDFPTGGFRTNSLVKCSLLSANSGAPQTLKLLTTFSRISSMSVHFATDDIRNYISESPYTVPWPNDVREANAIFSGSPGEPDLTVLGILDAFGSDLLKAMSAQKREWKISMDASEWPQQAVVKWGSRVNCTSWDKCRTKGNDVEGIEMWYSDTGGAQDYDAEYLTAMNTTLYNYFVMLRDAL
ncbi:unnamed protein product [Rhizoctonia solani]|uniref:Uncharacterized protein n=1 Tax=Rhizoctonia solani TaxID=456999 RepID=A0A8H3CDV3_9AGAM|nr:unnamed protein product [Rhizoctonia solani]